MDSVIWLGVVCGIWDEGLQMRRLAWRCVEVFLDTVTFLFLVYTPRNARLYTFHLVHPTLPRSILQLQNSTMSGNDGGEGCVCSRVARLRNQKGMWWMSAE
jgi:hypothetical protein